MTAPKRIPHNGASLTLKQLAKVTGHTYACLAGRWRKGDRDEKLLRPLEGVGNTSGRSPSSLRGEGASAATREKDALKRQDRATREQDRLARVAEVRLAHARAMAAPLIDSALLTDAERMATFDRVRFCGQRSWRVTGASMGVSL